MSGGRFNYYDCALANDIFKGNIDIYYDIGEGKQSEMCKLVRKQNPFKDKVISELVYDVLCLIHSFDWAESGDTSEEDYEKDVKAVKEKWLKGLSKNKEYTKTVIDSSIDELREELKKAFEIE